MTISSLPVPYRSASAGRGVVPAALEPGETGEHGARNGVDGILALSHRRPHDVQTSLEVPDGERGHHPGNVGGARVMDADRPFQGPIGTKRFISTFMGLGRGAGADKDGVVRGPGVRAATDGVDSTGTPPVLAGQPGTRAPVANEKA